MGRHVELTLHLRLPFSRVENVISLKNVQTCDHRDEVVM